MYSTLFLFICFELYFCDSSFYAPLLAHWTRRELCRAVFASLPRVRWFAGLRVAGSIGYGSQAPGQREVVLSMDFLNHFGISLLVRPSCRIWSRFATKRISCMVNTRDPGRSWFRPHVARNSWNRECSHSSWPKESVQSELNALQALLRYLVDWWSRFERSREPKEL